MRCSYSVGPDTGCAPIILQADHPPSQSSPKSGLLANQYETRFIRAAGHAAIEWGLTPERPGYEVILLRARNASASPSVWMVSAIHSAMSGAALSIALASASLNNSPALP